MSRTLSVTFKGAAFDQYSEEVLVALVSINHPDLLEPLYLSSDNAVLLDYEQQLRGTISRGRSYNFLPMDITLPEDSDDAGQVMQLVLTNVTQEVTPSLRIAGTPATVTVEIVLASAPNNVEIEFPQFDLVNADVDGEQVTLSLSVDAMNNEPFPADNFTPSTFGGLWFTT